MSVVAFPGQPNPVPDATCAMTAAAVDRFVDSITAATIRVGYAETLTRLTAVVGP